MPHREPSGSKIGLDRLRELEKPEAVGDAAPILADALGELLLGPGELRQELLVGLGLLDGVQVLAEQVLDEGELQALGIRRLAYHCGNLLETRELGCPPAPLSYDQLVPLPGSPDHDRLDDAGLAQGCGKLTQGIDFKVFSWLLGVGNYIPYGDVLDAASYHRRRGKGRRFRRGQERPQTTAKSVLASHVTAPPSSAQGTRPSQRTSCREGKPAAHGSGPR